MRLTVREYAKCTLRGWILRERATLEIDAHEGAEILLEGCDIAGTIDLVNEKISDVKIESVGARRDNGDVGIGIVKLRRGLQLVRSTLDLEQTPWAPALNESVALIVHEKSRVVLSLGDRGSISEVILGGATTASFWAHESVSIDALGSVAGSVRSGSIPRLTLAVGGEWADESGRKIQLPDAAFIGIGAVGTSNVDVNIRFQGARSYLLNVNSPSGDGLKLPIMVWTEDLGVADVKLFTDSAVEGQRIVPRGGTVLNRNSPEKI